MPHDEVAPRPGQWRAGDTNGTYRGVYDAKGEFVGWLPSDDAFALVRRENSHDALVAACEALLPYAEFELEWRTEGKPMIRSSIQAVVDRARAALTSAKGEVSDG